MSETDTIQYAKIRNHRYEEYFMNFQHNGKEISEEERREFIKVLDESISQYSEGLPMLKESIGSCEGKKDEFNNAYRTILSVSLFVVITSIDCFVIGKYFLLANTDYDKRFMRGKMKVILNEGFKKLYGFDEKTQKKSEWNKLSEIVQHLPLTIQFEYRKLSYLLDKQSKSSSWWRDERNLETHLDAERLYDSRYEEIIESKVMMDVTKLFSTLLAIQLFLTNVHALILNKMIWDFQNQEVKKN